MRKKRILQVLCLFIFIFALLNNVYAAQTITLTVWAVDALTTSNPQAAYVQALAKNFEKNNPDIKLDWVAFGTAGSPLNDKLKVALANNQGPDIFQSWGGSFMAG